MFRNLGFSGDELTSGQRSQSFGTPDEWLAKNETDVVLAFFGFNESFAGEKGLDQFKKDLDDFIKHTQGQKYNGEHNAKVVLISPIAIEDLDDPNLPDAEAQNKQLEAYTEGDGRGGQGQRRAVRRPVPPDPGTNTRRPTSR